VAVHDRYKSFDKAPDRVLHSYCNAHILRDLTAMAPRSLAARSRGWATFEELTNQSWPGKMKTLLLDMKAQVEQARTAGLKVALRGATALPGQQLAALETRYDDLTRDTPLRGCIALQSNQKAVKQPGQRAMAASRLGELAHHPRAI